MDSSEKSKSESLKEKVVVMYGKHAEFSGSVSGKKGGGRVLTRSALYLNY